MSKCNICKYAEKDFEEVPCLHCVNNAQDNFEKMSNGDGIRRMEDDELAYFLKNLVENRTLMLDFNFYEWLQSEYDGDL